MKTGLLFVGHGTRSPQGLQEFHGFVDGVERELLRDADTSNFVFARGFVELTEPGIFDAIDRLASAGVSRIWMVPLLLFAAGHWHHDIPEAAKAAAARWPGCQIEVLDAVGVDDVFVQVAAYRLLQAGYVPGSTTPVVLVGRGNRDQAAQAAFEATAAAIQRDLNIQHAAVGYLAGTGQTLETALGNVARLTSRSTIFVAPYLWFSGWLTDMLPNRVRQGLEPFIEGSCCPISIAAPLGLDERLIHRIVQPVEQAVVRRLPS